MLRNFNIKGDERAVHAPTGYTRPDLIHYIYTTHIQMSHIPEVMPTAVTKAPVSTVILDNVANPAYTMLAVPVTDAPKKGVRKAG